MLERSRDATANGQRLCILTQFFPPEVGAPQARLSELGEALVDRGWIVHVLTALPNYPTGRVFAGYRSMLPRTETVGRLRATRVPLVPSKSGIAARMGTYLTFAASAATAGPLLCPRPDLLWVESPPLFVGLAALALSAMWRRPFVLNVSDLWPESAVRMGLVGPGLALRAAEVFERRLYARAAGVTGQSTEIIDSIRRTVPGVRAELVTNGVSPSRFGPAFADQAARHLLGDQPGPVFVYAGLLGWAQGLDQLLDLARSLQEQEAGRVVIIGDGPERERLQRRVQVERIRRARLLPAQPRERVPALLAAAEAAFIPLGMHIPGAVPSKIYEAMASELPILLVADGEPARRVEEAGAGIAVAPGDPVAIRAAFRRLANDAALRRRLGRSGRKGAETTYNRARIADGLHDFLLSFCEQ